MVLIVGGVLAFGYYRIEAWRFRTGEAKRIAEAATVTGFVRMAIVDVPDGDNLPNAAAYFIGPAPRPDPLAVVSVPTIPLTAADPPVAPAWDPTKYVGIDYPVATGRRADGCYASATFITNPKPSVEDFRRHSIAVLAPEQLDEVRKGSKVFIELDISGCG
ncbi:hypothetical protein ACIHDR_17435 [Nocardia sp. NPDC052278]|uniref:hypothetical protein n=1 Tax=unclassified Nocardia TaxID=2637762 RepID=UPI0036908BE0